MASSVVKLRWSTRHCQASLNLAKCRVFSPWGFGGPPKPAPRPIDEGSTFFGVPVGPDGFDQGIAAERLELMLQRLKLLDSSLAKFLLLRSCLGVCRINHHLARQGGSETRDRVGSPSAGRRAGPSL